MILVGLTGWGDHPSLYSNLSTARDKLFDYSGHFPIVEVDTSFYAIPAERNVKKWCSETPPNFQFVLKTYQGITGHLRDELPFETRNDMFESFRACAKAFQDEGKLGMVLVQFPPWYDCQAKNVTYIRYVKEQLKDFPIAIEFRNQTWYAENNREMMLQFLKDNKLIHSVCDEPQAGSGSVPLVSISTTEDKVLFRIHGRNIHGWRNAGNNQNWREVRFLYDYNEEELRQIADTVLSLKEQSKDVYVLFNNNSGHHAAKNAKQLMSMLEIEYSGLSPKQLDLFEGEI
ncbi:putative protein YecE OS=Ureibacillus acetophenoni OX=614649 GN=SAMN05877842_109100 PE=4 SV=1 [Ureibacillus acetophenoni]